MLRPIAVLLAVLAPALAQAAQPAQPLRPLSSFSSGSWQVVTVGTDERVNHCAVERGSFAAKPKPGEPRVMFQVDEQWAILSVRSTDYRFAGKKPLAITLVGSDGTEQTPKAAAGGWDRADIAYANGKPDLLPLVALKYLDVRMDDTSVRVPMDGFAEVLLAFSDCVKSIGKPAEGWTTSEVDALIGAVSRGEAKCREESGRTICDR
jgi:hypothetical protein